MPGLARKEAHMRVVIVGAGPAGVTVAETLRAFDHSVEVMMFSAEPYPPYSPPAMADHFLTGSTTHLWRGEDWPGRVGVEYRQGTAVGGLEAAEHRLRLHDDTRVTYDRLVIASGSRLYAPLEGNELPGIYNFKSLSAAEGLVARVKSGEAHEALIVGAGFIGVEIAILLRKLGLEVTMLEMLDHVMPRVLAPETAVHVEGALAEMGIRLRLNTKATAFTGNGRAEGVSLEDGQTLKSDVLVAATGVRPNIDWLEGSGLDVKWGIQVDDHMRTSLPEVYAAGDVVESTDRLTGERFVNAIFPNAVAQGVVVGLNLAGNTVLTEGTDRMNSLKHLGVPVVVAGLKDGDEILHQERDGGMRLLFLREHRLVGFQMVGDVRPAGVLRALMNRRLDIRALKDRLLDPTFGQGKVAWGAISGVI
jgi:NADPH-dependent 2,4-dienoyl-CoA reductase/sulfur reductase-like enzyme